MAFRFLGVSMLKRRILRAAALPLFFAGATFVGCAQIIGVDEPVACTSDDACNTADRPCVAGECVDGYCAYALRAEGTVIDTAGELDCKSHVCDDAGEVVEAAALDDAPPDDTPGDCVAPACDDTGAIVSAPNDADVPSGDMPGDCKKPGCVDGTPTDVDDDADVPEDTTVGDCESPGCDAGQVVTQANPMDTPAEDIDGDCLAPTCSAMGGVEVDDTDTPTSGCGGCSNGVVVAWPEEGMACYTGATGTQNVGPCVGGTWACQDNVKVCAGEVTPAQEQCGPGFSGVDDDCDTSTDEEGPGCACMLGQTQSCYTGPAATQGVGTCSDGVATCMSTGMGNQFGSCVGEVLPQACDSCIVGGDQDCSGSAESCTGNHVFSKGFGTTTGESMRSVIQTSNGELVALGSFQGSLTSGSAITSDGGYDIMLLRFDADGNAINARDFGGTASDYAGGLVEMNDGYLAWGTLSSGSSETFGSGATLTAVGTDGFVAKFNSNHTLAWKKLIGGTSNDGVKGVAKMPDNGIVVVGQFAGTINLGGSNLVSAGFDDIFVARFDASGNHVWSKRFGDAQQNSVEDVGVAPNGDLVFVGVFGTSANFGGSTINVVGGVDAYVARLDQNGNHVWTKAFQSAGDEYANKVGVLSDGSVWVVGTFDTAVNVDGVSGTDVSPTSTGSDILMVKYSAAGAYQSGRSVNGSGATYIWDVAVGFDDALVVSGAYDGTLYTNTLNVPSSSGSTDAFIFKTNTGGIIQWARKPGDSGLDMLSGVDVGACGDVFAVGSYNGNVNFGGGNLPNQGMADAVIAKFRQ